MNALLNNRNQKKTKPQAETSNNLQPKVEAPKVAQKPAKVIN